MADYIDQLYEAKRNANTNALKQRRDEQLAQYDTQGAQDTQAYNQGLPQFQNDMNQADVGAFQDTQRLAERAAQSGNYNGGQTDSNLARIMQTASNNKAGFKNQENQFKQNYANNQNTLAGSRARANNAYSGDIASSNMSIDSEYAQARNQQAEQAAALARQLQAQRAAASAAATRSKAAPNPTAGQLTAAATGQAQNYLNQWASGNATNDNGDNIGRATRDGILNWVNQNAGDLTSQGINTDNLYNWADKTFQWNPEPAADPAPYQKTLADWNPFNWR